jgi:hypothetical protein
MMSATVKEKSNGLLGEVELRIRQAMPAEHCIAFHAGRHDTAFRSGWGGVVVLIERVGCDAGMRRGPR